MFSSASVVAPPSLQPDSTKIMEEYSRNSSYMVNLSQAIGRLLLAGRDLTRFAGYTWRVAEFFDSLLDIKKGNYARGAREESSSLNLDILAHRGTVVEADGVIDFKDVPIVTPNGDILVPHLSFRIESGMNCIITGPNGCGKSSLFRILGDLWPLYGGTVIKPKPSKMFYVPQKPYMTIGTLRDQIIYPDTQQEAISKGYDDNCLLALLKVVHLEYLVERSMPGSSGAQGESLPPQSASWSSVQDWADVLSGGEKQRVAMARLFYHRPQFAILDECTSAVSVDVEGPMYEHAKALQITLFTVSHRPSLFRFHEYLLKFDGCGGYEFKPLSADDPLRLSSGQLTPEST